MAYDPDRHHRRSLRLPHYNYAAAGAYFITICVHQRQCLFGEMVGGAMRLNEFGEVARSHWQKLPRHHPPMRLDAFVIMPNHIHGIIMLLDSTDPAVGAGLAHNPSASTQTGATKPALPPVSRSPIHPHSGRAGFARHPQDMNERRSAKPAPTEATGRDQRHGIPEIVRGYKTFSARRINRIRRVRGVPVWQRNYYEHIIRNETALTYIRQYIHNNPASWQQDQLHPDCPSKW